MTVPAAPALQYLVAFNNSALDDPAAITTVAAPAGTLGGANVWTDITPWVSGHQIQRGRQHELDQFQAGTCQLDLNNGDGRFNSWNTTGPYYGLLKIRKLVQVRVTWQGVTYNRFTGQVDAWPTLWADNFTSFAQVHASDAYRMWQLADLTTQRYPAQVVADGAAQYWRLGEPAGSTNALNQIPTGVVGSYQGSYTLGSAGAMLADPGTSVNLSPAGGGVPGGWVQLPTGGTSPTTFTLEGWVRASTWANGYSEDVIVAWADNADNGAFFYVNPNSPIAGTLELDILDDAGNYSEIRTTTTVPADSAWHHVVAVRDGTAHTTALYIDGVAQPTTGPSSATAPAGVPITFLGIGAFVTVAPSWPGDLQDVAIYPTALTAAQVADHYSLATWPQEQTGARVNRVLTALGWPAGARQVDAGVSTVQAATQSLVTTTSLQMFQSCEATEGGAFFVDVSGRARFVNRDALLAGTVYTTSQATFGDDTAAADIPFAPNPTLGLDDIDLFNEASGQRSGGARQVWDDNTSIDTYGRSTWQPAGTLLGISDAEVLGRCQYIVYNHADPQPRLSSITVDMFDLLEVIAQPTAIFGLELLYRVTVRRLGIPGSAFSQQGLVEQISETVTPDSWTVTFGLDVADTTAYWVLGTSQLGVNTALAY
jgi:hypothetical protein